MSMYLLELKDCDGADRAGQYHSAGVHVRAGNIIRVEDREWRVVAIRDSGVDQIKEKLLCVPAEGCDYELVLLSAGTEGAEIVDRYHHADALVRGSRFMYGGLARTVVNIEESGYEERPRLVCTPAGFSPGRLSPTP